MQKDEIKDLLQYLKNVYESEETSTWLNKLQIKDLFDYITNLQTIEREYSAILSENAELENKITNLQEENERLKEENKHIFANVNDDKLLRSNAMNYAELQDYKQRNEKAIEKLKDLYSYADNEEYVDNYCKDLLNILQGKSDE